METAVNAIIAPLRSNNCFGSLYPWQTEIYSDFQLGRGSYAVLNNYQGLDNTNIARVGSMWNEFYLAIRNANLVIANAPDATKASEADIIRYTSEARFLRAFSYAAIIPYFGKLPLRTESNISATKIPLSSSEEIYSLIFEDLEYAEQYLPDNPSVAGRPTKWAAKTALAHIYFLRGDYQEAVNKSEEIINSNQFSLVGVETVDDWQKLFGPTLISTTEEIFYIKNSKESGWFFVDFMDTERIGNGANDYPFYRYADVLLIYAESVGRVNNNASTEAIEKLNMVHRRAYGKDPNQPSDVDFTTDDFPDLQSFVDVVVMERGYETIYEGGKRWLDLLRLGRDYTKNTIKKVHGKDIAEKHFLWPIPTSEIDLNDAIDESEQNPGY